MIKFYENGYLIIQDIDRDSINKKIIDDKIKVAIFSGGWFWCIADPFYNMELFPMKVDYLLTNTGSHNNLQL